jgi:hypothetical protein
MDKVQTFISFDWEDMDSYTEQYEVFSDIVVLKYCFKHSSHCSHLSVVF